MQKYEPLTPLTFDSAYRKSSNTVFSAPLYGPSLRYLGLIAGDALARDGTSTGIPLAAEDLDSEKIVLEVEHFLASCPEMAELARLKPTPLDGPALDRLGLHGLNPACYRQARAATKRAFLRKFLVPRRAGDWADYRRRTARLILASVGQFAFEDFQALRLPGTRGCYPMGPGSNWRTTNSANTESSGRCSRPARSTHHSRGLAAMLRDRVAQWVQ